MNKYCIEQMTFEEVQIAIEWAAKEGWNPGLNDASCFYATDPNGFFVGKLAGEIIVVGSAVIYDENFAFCGFYITKPEFRHQGYGIQLTEARLKYVGNRMTGIDGVITMTEKYARIGYKVAHNNIRFAGNKKPQEPAPKVLTPLAEIDFQEVRAFDRSYFPAHRDRFLDCWLNQPTGIALALIEKGKLLGYGVSRKCRIGYKIGPLFAEDYEIAETIFRGLIAKSDEPFYLDVPEPNANAVKLAKRFDMSQVFATARMYRNGFPAIDLAGIYGITTFELG